MAKKGIGPGRVLDGLIRRFGQRQLLILTGALFLVDLFLVDPIPFVDELFLGLLTYHFATWKQTRVPPEPIEKEPEKNVTPPAARR